MDWLSTMRDHAPLVAAAVGLLALFAAYAFTQLTVRTEQLLRLQGELVDTEQRLRALQAEMDGRIARIIENSPMEVTPALHEQLRGATFAILDEGGHPVCSGFFVTPCGVALAAAHACAHARRPRGASPRLLRASSPSGREFTLGVVAARVGALDVAVLRVPASGALPSAHLPLPSATRSDAQLLGAPVALIHGSIAWSSAGADARRVALDSGYIITSSDSKLLYCLPACEPLSGAALLFRSGHVLGLHTGGCRDLAHEHLERSRSTRAEAVRLDVPQVWGAVQAAAAAAAAPSAASGGSGAAGLRQRGAGAGL